MRGRLSCFASETAPRSFALGSEPGRRVRCPPLACSGSAQRFRKDELEDESIESVGREKYQGGEGVGR